MVQMQSTFHILLDYLINHQSSIMNHRSSSSLSIIIMNHHHRPLFTVEKEIDIGAVAVFYLIYPYKLQSVIVVGVSCSQLFSFVISYSDI